MKVLQITDTHVGRPGFTGYGLDPRTRLEACVADINAHHADAALCLVTGDLVNDGSHDEYANLEPVLRALRVPFRVLAGNHDARAELLRFFPHTPVDEDGFLQGTLEVPGGRIVILDTLCPGKPSGELCAKRLDWLGRALAARQDTVYIFMHHPPLPIGIEYMDGIGLLEPEGFWRTVAPHRERVRLLVFGHVHRPVSGVWNGIAFAGCPSTAHQVALELGRQAEPHLSFNHEPPCYAILDIGAAGVIVHQQRFLQNWNLIPRRGKPPG
jgi:3',5'-cyclic AMP phosphodiesterase CpdA